MTITLEPETTATATVMVNSSTSGTPILSVTTAAGTAVAAMMQPEFDIPLIGGIVGGREHQAGVRSFVSQFPANFVRHKLFGVSLPSINPNVYH